MDNNTKKEPFITFNAVTLSTGQNSLFLSAATVNKIKEEIVLLEKKINCPICNTPEAFGEFPCEAHKGGLSIGELKESMILAASVLRNLGNDAKTQTYKLCSVCSQPNLYETCNSCSESNRC